MDYSKLRPLVADYPAEMSDQDVADALNAKTSTRRVLVPLWQVKRALIELGVWAVLKAMDSPLAKTAVDYIDDLRFEHLDLDLVSTQTMLAGFVQGGLLTAEQVAMLDGMANEAVSIAELNGMPEVSSGHIATARAWKEPA